MTTGNTFHSEALRHRHEPRYVLAVTAPLQLLLVAWGALFIGGIAEHALLALDRSPPALWLFLGVGVVLAALTPLTTVRLTGRGCARRCFRVENGRLLFQEGILRPRESSIALSAIERVELHRGWMQARHGLGELVLWARSEEREGCLLTLRILDLHDAEHSFEQLNRAIAGGKGGSAVLSRAA